MSVAQIPQLPQSASTDGDLTVLLRSFNDVAERLQATHDTLRHEVARLEGELRDAKDQLRRARQLAALGEMAAGIAHEIRNPLGSIKLYASALSTDLGELPEQQVLATKIAGAVSNLDAVVGDVLTFARELRVRPEPCCAGDLVEPTLDACADLWAAHGVDIHPPRAGMSIELIADTGLIQQALINVVRNAAESISEHWGPAGVDAGGERRIDLSLDERRALDAEGQGAPMIAIVVRDTGRGLAPEILDRVFNPFFTTRHTGTGLGLAIVHRIVDAHGGRVILRNNGDEAPANGRGGSGAPGATVEILLPARGPAEQREEALR